MRSAALLLLAALLQNTPPAPQQLPARGGLLQPPAAAQQPGSVDGIVVEAGSGRSLPLATVQLQARNAPGAAGTLVTNTRDDGTFTFRSVPPGPYFIQAGLGGYIPETYGNAPDPFGTPTQQLTPGQKVSGIRLSLTRGAVISGRLTDDRGDVLVGTIVQALRTTYKNGLRERKVVQSVISNDLGEYRLFMLRPGEYHVSVNPAPQRQAVPYYFPGTFDAKASQPLDLHEGEMLAGVSFSAIPTRTKRVTGSVQGNGDDAVGVVLSPLNSTSSVRQTLDPNTGTFQFSDVAPGPYTLVARTISARSAISLDVRNADVLNLRISLGAGFRIPVHAHIEGHAAGDDPELEKLYFVARAETAVPGMDAETYSPFADGHFILDLAAGDYRIDITQPEGLYVKSMTLGGIDVLNPGLHVTGSTDQMEILIASGVGSVAGRTGGRNATVVLVPDPVRRGQRALFKSMGVGAGGDFHFDKVPPGDYKLFAWAEETAENGGPWLDPEYLRKYEDRGTPVHIDADRKTMIDRPIPVF